MRQRLLIVALGATFVAVTSILAPERAWIEAVSESFVPYCAVPVAVGSVVPRSPAARTVLMGAGASVVMALAFYLARPIVDTAHGTLWSDLFYWAVVGLISPLEAQQGAQLTPQQDAAGSERLACAASVAAT